MASSFLDRGSRAGRTATREMRAGTIEILPQKVKPINQSRSKGAYSELPADFARLPDCDVRPNEEQVDGSGCVVLEVPLEEGTETIWLDAGLEYSPRKWELRIGNRLVWRRTNNDFREFASGCWLPLEAAASFGPPVWTSLVPPDQSVYTRRMSLRFARVNDVPDNIFTKEHQSPP